MMMIRLASAITGVGHCDMDLTGVRKDDKKQSRESSGRWMSGGNNGGEWLADNILEF